MSDLEYYFTLASFGAGFVLLIYLFRVRARVMRNIKTRMLQAKAKLHYMTRPNDTVNVWGNEDTRKRDIR